MTPLMVSYRTLIFAICLSLYVLEIKILVLSSYIQLRAEELPETRLHLFIDQGRGKGIALVGLLSPGRGLGLG